MRNPKQFILVTAWLLFLLGWLAGVAAIDWVWIRFVPSQTLYAILEPGATFVFGVLYYATALLLFARAWSPRIRWLAVLAGLLIPVVSFFASYSLQEFSYDPIGSGDDTGSGPCVATNEDAALFSWKKIAKAKEVHCLGDWDEPSTYFVFVHNIDDPDARDNLVFRYRGGWAVDRWGQPPKLVWRHDGSLQIVVQGNIEQVTEQRPAVTGVPIEYKVPPPECPSTVNGWQRLRWHFARWIVWC